jgi:hypothetical protein
MTKSRKALVVGIDHYDHIDALAGCVNDARAVAAMLERNEDRKVNFGVKLMVAPTAGDSLPRASLKEAVRELFSEKRDVALFYFAGHGHVEATGGYLCGTDCRTGDDGLPLAEIMAFANKSKASNKIIILDSCHSGIAGDHPTNDNVAEVAEGVTILTASTKEQYAAEINGGGVFTGLMIDALMGAAANLVGDVTPGSIYAHIDQSLGTWGQRPVFKTNVETFVSLRSVTPALELVDLQRIAEFFPVAGHEYQLDPGYEPESGCPDPTKTPIFRILQKFNRVGLVVPVGTTHPYHAAMESKTMKLTALGEHYRRLAKKGLI